MAGSIRPIAAVQGKENPLRRVACVKQTKNYRTCNAVIVASNLDDGLSAGTVVLAFGFKALIVASNRLLGLSAGTVVLQLLAHRLLIVASNC